MIYYMKIGLIRHFPVNHSFLKGFVSQAEVIQWFHAYNTAEIHKLDLTVDKSWDLCYSSELLRAKRTAEAIYQGDVICSELLNEPFPDWIFKKDFRLPFVLWGMLIRFAILWNHSSQSQRKEIIEARIQKLLREILSLPDKNVLIVSHVFAMEIMSALLIREGFKGPELNRPANGVLYMYERK